MTLCLAQEPDADGLLSRDPFALLAGMLLDQQFPMERAFAGPYLIAQRMGTPDRLDPAAIVATDPEAFRAIMTGPPAVHRYPGSMGERVQALAAIVVETYGGDASTLWREADGRRRPVRPAAGAARVRQAEVADLRGPARQAARSHTATVGRPRPAPTPRRAAADRSRTSATPGRWPRCARTSRRPRRPLGRPRAADGSAGGGRHRRPDATSAACRRRRRPWPVRSRSRTRSRRSRRPARTPSARTGPAWPSSSATVGGGSRAARGSPGRLLGPQVEAQSAPVYVTDDSGGSGTQSAEHAWAVVPLLGARRGHRGASLRLRRPRAG